jgi:hypothetical protein
MCRALLTPAPAGLRVDAGLREAAEQGQEGAYVFFILFYLLTFYYLWRSLPTLDRSLRSFYSAPRRSHSAHTLFFPVAIFSFRPPPSPSPFCDPAHADVLQLGGLLGQGREQQEQGAFA